MATSTTNGLLCGQLLLRPADNISLLCGALVMQRANECNDLDIC